MAGQERRALIRAEPVERSSSSPFYRLRAHLDKTKAFLDKPKAHCFRHAQRSDPTTLGTAPP